MIRPRLVLLAETTLLDRETNSLSVINVVDQIRPAGYPVLIPRLVIAAIFEREEGDDATGQAQARLALGDESLVEDTLDLEFGDGRLNRSLLRFDGFVLPHPGDIRIHVAVQGLSMESYLVQAMPAPIGPPEITQGPTGPTASSH